jgi:hypothetical protein
MSEAPMHVTIAIGATMRQLKKSELPKELQEIYPLD